MSMNGFCPNGYTDYLSREENQLLKGLSLDIVNFRAWNDLPAENFVNNHREWHIQKSFYGKAKIYADTITGWFVMTSYNTPICAINRNDGRFIRFWPEWSVTTSKHIRAFCMYMLYDVMTDINAIRVFNGALPAPVYKKGWLSMPICNFDDFIIQNNAEHD